MREPDVQIVVTIPRECNKESVEALRAACDGALAAMNASEYKTGREWSCEGYTAYHFTRSVRFVIEAPAAPPETAAVEVTE